MAENLEYSGKIITSYHYQVFSFLVWNVPEYPQLFHICKKAIYSENFWKILKKYIDIKRFVLQARVLADILLTFEN